MDRYRNLWCHQVRVVLLQFLELPNGIPSHDTFARLFGRLNPQQFQQCFLDWIKAINKITEGEVIAIDGKALRHSYDKGADKKAIHMVSAWATEIRLVLEPKGLTPVAVIKRPAIEVKSQPSFVLA